MTDEGIWGLVRCSECGIIGAAKRSTGRVDIFLEKKCYHPREFWNVIVRTRDLVRLAEDASMPKGQAARVVKTPSLQPGDIQVWAGKLMLMSCPKCGRNRAPSGTTWVEAEQSTAGEKFECECGWTGHIVDGRWTWM